MQQFLFFIVLFVFLLLPFSFSAAAGTLTRADMMKMLMRARYTEEQTADKKNCFLDVKKQWYAPYVCYAKELGIISGYADGRFRPGRNVKMAEAYKTSIATFGFDLAKPHEGQKWYAPAVEFMHVNNIFSKFAVLPGKDISRSEMSSIIRQLKLLHSGKKQLQTRRNSRSLGCGKTPPRIIPRSSVIQGVQRNYITVIPNSYEKNTATKLVFAFHGRTNSNEMVRGYYGVEQASNGEAIFIYPAGLRSGGGYSWSNPGDAPDQLRDFALFDQLLREFSEKYCIDMDQIYVVGHSLGAWFVNSLGCARGKVIRAIGTVGGGTTIGNCTGPVAAFISHNPKDNLVPYEQGIIARDQLKSQNQCSDKLLSVPPKSLNCRAYQGCGDYAPLMWCPHHVDYAHWDGSYYPHTWPKDTSAEIWKFFKGLEN